MGGIRWTCCQCGHSFDYDEGDTEERMCFECLYDEDEDNYVQTLNKDAKIDSQIPDLIALLAILGLAYYFYSHLW